jgi:outer membrane protein OmpA-like peptidoglycan-associated protein
MSGQRLTLPRACGPGLAAAALLGGALLGGTLLLGNAASAAGSEGATGAPTAGLRHQLDRAQSLLQLRLSVLPADSGVLLLRDPDRLTLRIPARMLFEYDTPVLWQQQPATETPGPLALPLLATVQLMNKYRALQAQIVVYTDSIGAVSVNQSLSDARAQAVYQALTAAGIAPDRLQQHGAGAATMVAGNQTPQGRIENRRVEIEFRPEPAAAP